VNTGVTTVNVVEQFRPSIERLLSDLSRTRPGDPEDFVPRYQLPPPTPELSSFLAAAQLSVVPLPEYRGRRLTLLNLMHNPATRTTKTLASLVMVARAACHIRETGEPIMILTPSSANKAVALRDAVLRAIQSGLVTAEELRIVVVVPVGSKAKLWRSALSEDATLLCRNPVAVCSVGRPGDVKRLARAMVERHQHELFARSGLRLWHTLEIGNYKVADAVRALVEAERLPAEPSSRRLHAHAVSSAFGLLGHALGRRMLAEQGIALPIPQYFLVQHLGTPDMVLSLYFGSTSRENLPRYEPDERTGLYAQGSDPRFPSLTFDPAEVLDPTFYTTDPPTCTEINSLIRADGGGGLVVSLYECLHRYAEIRRMLAPAGVCLPADPRRLREWSLVMAVAGVLTGVDRGLIETDDILVHGSGSYSDDDFEPIPAEHLSHVDGEAALWAAMASAAAR
jgi:hypothetical protein